MTLEDRRRCQAGEDAGDDKFPVGMRVLAVDDDPTCLKVLESLLRKCQYHVTSTNQAIEALKMLRDSRNKFDLVISDVNMPDMDGFKLLELVGLEMDLPVIMLSGYSDTELVMKGITHGACDYLLKPVRMEELKNIWQHVIRRKKVDSKEQKKSSNQGKACHGNGESEYGLSPAGNADNGRKIRKRKDQNEDEDEDGDDNQSDSEDPSNQKKPRVVWTTELHKKFLVAVYQLGREKAFPKKILDLMNVEGLTRENVASHLQKYRLFLKRNDVVAAQQANLAASMGYKDACYMRTGSIDGYSDLGTLAGSGRLSSARLSSYQPRGVLSRLNSPAELTLHGIVASGLVQRSTPPNLNPAISGFGNVPQATLMTNPKGSVLEGRPASLEISRLQQGRSAALNREFSSLNDASAFTVPTSFPDTTVSVGCPSDSVSASSLIMQVNMQQTRSCGASANQPSGGVTSLNQESFGVGINGYNSFNHDQQNERWQSGGHLGKYPSNAVAFNQQNCFNHLASNNSSSSLTNPVLGRIPVDLPPRSAVSAPVLGSRDGQYQEGLIGNIVQGMSRKSKLRWEEHKHGYNQNMGQIVNRTSTLMPADDTEDLAYRELNAGDTACGMQSGVPLVSQFNGVPPSYVQHGFVEKSSVDSKMNSCRDVLLDHVKPMDESLQSSYDSLDDMLNIVMKGEENHPPMPDADFAFDAYSLG